VGGGRGVFFLWREPRRGLRIAETGAGRLARTPPEAVGPRNPRPGSAAAPRKWGGGKRLAVPFPDSLATERGPAQSKNQGFGRRRRAPPQCDALLTATPPRPWRLGRETQPARGTAAMIRLAQMSAPRRPIVATQPCRPGKGALTGRLGRSDLSRPMEGPSAPRASDCFSPGRLSRAPASGPSLLTRLGRSSSPRLRQRWRATDARYCFAPSRRDCHSMFQTSQRLTIAERAARPPASRTLRGFGLDTYADERRFFSYPPGPRIARSRIWPAPCRSFVHMNEPLDRVYPV